MLSGTLISPLSGWAGPGLEGYTALHYQLTPEQLVQQTLSRGQGRLADSGALVIRTGKFTGRSPQDRYLVKDDQTASRINWNEFNIPISEDSFDRLFHRLIRYFRGKEIWMRDGYVCADPAYRINIRVITETPWANLFCHHLLLRPAASGPADPDWLVIQAPGYQAIPELQGTRKENFSIINLSRRIIIIGGTAYTGEIKKGIFSMLNYLLPQKMDVLGMHCSANMGIGGDTALFFGLSGTGKTTLSTDEHRKLIGDDEHGWSDSGIFNFEGGCYAKCIDLRPEKEPQIYKAIRKGAMLENVQFLPGTKRVDYQDRTITENTRVSYPLYYLDQVQDPPMGPPPRHIFFLTCDANGVLPPISSMDSGQTMYQYISGYTAKVAGTEIGISAPKSTFSTCFGAPFLPLHPMVYARMLGEKVKRYRTSCWLINTGWTGGPIGQGYRIALSQTRAMIAAVLNGKLEKAAFIPRGLFRLSVPEYCPGVPSEMLDPRKVWSDAVAYDMKEQELVAAFRKNFEPFATAAWKEMLDSGPHNPC